jgi:hypothetical protein
VLDPIIDEIFRAARAAGRQEPHEAYAFDALMILADRACGRTAPNRSSVNGATDHQAADVVDTASNGDGSGGRVDTGSAPASGQSDTPPPQRRLNERYLALLRVDVEALRRGGVTGDQLCEISGVGPVPVTVARELLGAEAGHHPRDRRVQRDPSRARAHRRPAHCPRVDQPRLHGRRLRPHSGRIRPPPRLEGHPPHPPRRTRPALRISPRPQDPPALGSRPRARQTTPRTARRPPPPQASALRATPNTGRPWSRASCERSDSAEGSASEEVSPGRSPLGEAVECRAAKRSDPQDAAAHHRALQEFG